MKKPSVSLIITTYNRPDALGLVLKSALAQHDPPEEIIIADDGSGNETRELIKKFQNESRLPIKHCWHEDLGFRLAAIRNRAIAMATCEYIVMIDGDIVLPPHFIQSHRKFARPNYFVQGSRILLNKKATIEALQSGKTHFNFLSSGIKNRLNSLYLPCISKWASFPTLNWEATRGCNQAYWRNDVIKINGFNEAFKGWGREDSEFMVRMLNTGIKCLKVKLEAFGYHLYHPENSKKMLDENQKILEKAITEKLIRCEDGISKYL